MWFWFIETEGFIRIRNDQTTNKASWSFETPWTKDQGYKDSI